MHASLLVLKYRALFLFSDPSFSMMARIAIFLTQPFWSFDSLAHSNFSYANILLGYKYTTWIFVVIITILFLAINICPFDHSKKINYLFFFNRDFTSSQSYLLKVVS